MKCQICETSSNNKKFIVKEMMYGTNQKFLYFECINCGCLQLEKIPRNLSDHYPFDYYSVKINSFLKNFILNFVFVIQYLSYKKIPLISFLVNLILPNHSFISLNKIKLSKNHKILDVGSGSGLLIKYLSKLGFIDLMGIDPFIKSDLIIKKGVLLRKKEIFDLKNKFHVIMFHHSFEHLSSPYLVMKKTRELLYKNGICIIRIPTVSSFAWKYYKENWVQLDAPRHFFLHSIKSINFLARKSKFKIEMILFDSYGLQFYGSESYKRGKNLTNSDFSKIAKIKFNYMSNKLNERKLGDSIVIYLRKI